MPNPPLQQAGRRSHARTRRATVRGRPDERQRRWAGGRWIVDVLNYAFLLCGLGGLVAGVVQTDRIASRLDRWRLALLFSGFVLTACVRVVSPKPIVLELLGLG